MKTRNLTFLSLALAALLAATACRDQTFHAPPGEELRAFAAAEEIVTGMAHYYANRYHGGQVRAFAIDPKSLDWFDDPSLLTNPDHYVHAPALEEGLRRVAEQLPYERASWILRFLPVEEVADIPDGHIIQADVIDLHAPNCCVIVAAGLVLDENGWEVMGVDLGGHMTETVEFQQWRLERGAEVLR